jgi:hypothetical protein
MSIIEFIQDRARYYNCPVCGRNLKGCEVRMLNHVEDRFTVQVTCATCHVTFIVILAIQGQGLEMVQEGELDAEVEVHELRDEVRAADDARGYESGPIELDELLDVHLMLRGFDGTLTDLLKQPEQPRK